LCLRHEGVELNGRWFCSPQCFESALRRRFAERQPSREQLLPVRHRIPLGLMMLSRGQLNNHQLRAALDAQRRHGGRLGAWFEQLGYATEQQVTAALGMQWACPVLPVVTASDLNCSRLIPFPILKRFRMLPVRSILQTRTVFMAFSEGLDYGAMNAIEEMLECRTEPCLVGSGALDIVLKSMEAERCPGEFLFSGQHDPVEMARITTGFVLKLGGRRVRLVSYGDYAWVRLEGELDPANLVFSLPAAAEHLPTIAS
jgi:hypothetical protein